MTKINDKFGNVLFECESNDVKDCVEKAMKSGACLRSADLYGANLHGANLGGADLYCANLGGAHLRGANLGGAHLRGADLYGAHLRGANLGGADLYCANLYGTNLRGAILHDANLYGTNLRGANLRDADLHGAILCYANLRGADLSGADLRDANLYCANLHGAILHDAENIPYIPLACPSDGEFTAWKKVDGKLVKLLIPADARRSSATKNKCRCDKAMVVAITSIDEKEDFKYAESVTYTPMTYKVGEMVYPDSFDEDRWNECSNGIHFFVNKKEAINY